MVFKKCLAIDSVQDNVLIWSRQFLAYTEIVTAIGTSNLMIGP